MGAVKLQHLTLLCLLSFANPESAFATRSFSESKKCAFSDLKEPLKSLSTAFKRSEKLTLGEKVPAQKDKATELILRTKTKNWTDFDWKLRPLEIVAVLAAQDIYFDRCSGKEAPLLDSLLDDFKNKKISLRDRKKAMRSFFLLIPCMDDKNRLDIIGLASEYFFEDTEDFVSLLISSESEVSGFAPDYKACTSKDFEKFYITNELLAGIDRRLEKQGLDKTLLLRLKRLRSSKMQFETGKYFFEKMDGLLTKASNQK
ncbi:MAG: hypothetical protein R3A80_00935 [Bdellovibrionota bacterium]